MTDAESRGRRSVNDLERKLALVGYARAALYVLMGIASFVAFWAGIKYAAKAPVVSGAVLVMLCLLPIALWVIIEYLGHLGGKYVRQLLEKKSKSRQ